MLTTVLSPLIRRKRYTEAHWHDEIRAIFEKKYSKREKFD
jgi:hypothetical protein